MTTIRTVVYSRKQQQHITKWPGKVAYGVSVNVSNYTKNVLLCGHTCILCVNGARNDGDVTRKEDGNECLSTSVWTYALFDARTKYVRL
ncbi:hypothetical protein KDW_35290 [Dictyobacter vulcani]|uniref:Uncharacterized protein n=1 Tax=Dictyobacter vulcani TaxID=2607529 RepID=A0A5J4KSI2_9CHLR|nr:hypothetical protein KDW_35290 [Dictyobacter vulcani]